MISPENSCVGKGGEEAIFAFFQLPSVNSSLALVQAHRETTCGPFLSLNSSRLFPSYERPLALQLCYETTHNFNAPCLFFITQFQRVQLAFITQLSKLGPSSSASTYFLLSKVHFRTDFHRGDLITVKESRKQLIPILSRRILT